MPELCIPMYQTADLQQPVYAMEPFVAEARTT